MLKEIIHPTTGTKFKMGRTRPTQPHKRVSMRMLKSAGVLPEVDVPDTTNYGEKGADSLKLVYKNDAWGCCVVSGGFHHRGVTSGNAGEIALFTDEQVQQDYSAISGFDPAQTDEFGNNPTDQGCDENTALAYWQTNGFADGVKLVNAVAVDAASADECRLALFLFESLFFGVELPDAWVNPFPGEDGFTWDVAGDPIPENGHCFLAYDIAGPDSFKIGTWGMTGNITQAAVSKYAAPSAGGQLFALLSPDIISRVTEKSPAGYDIETLIHYLNNLPRAWHPSTGKYHH